MEKELMDRVDTSALEQDILSKVFPNIEQRKARVDFLLSMFSDLITSKLITLKEQLAGMSAEEKFNSGWDIVERELNKGTEAEQRVYLLGLPLNGGKSVVENILDDIRDTFREVVETVERGPEGINVIVDRLILATDENGNPANIIAKDFAEQSYDFGWDGEKQRKIAVTRAKVLASAFKQMLNEDIFAALVNEMQFDLAFNENIRLDMSAKTAIQTKNDVDNTDLNEGNVDANKEGYMVKYKLMDPSKTLSARIKKMLSELYMTKSYSNGSWTYVYDDLGRRVKLNSSVAYYILLDEFSKMSGPEDFLEMMNNVREKYPWFNELYDKVIVDPADITKYDAETMDAMQDLMREFYTAMRKAEVPYGMTSSSGRFVRLNQNATADTFLHEVQKYYEGGMVLGPNSIYNADGQCDEKNVKKLSDLLRTGGRVTEENFEKYHPFAWIGNVLMDNSRLHTVPNILKAIRILQGRDENHPGISLETALNNIGINTSYMDMTAVLPYIDNFTDESTLGEVKQVITDTVINRLKIIFGGMMNITREKTGETGGYHTGDNLIIKFQNTYLKIGNVLTLASEDYTQASFLAPDKTQRFTYASPDRISEIVGSINNPNIEKGSDYIMKNFGVFDFFRHNGIWRNTMLQKLYEIDPRSGNYWVRNRFQYVNMLNFGGSEESNTIGKIDKHGLIRGFIDMFNAANDDSQGHKFGWYACPLFSDTDACVMIQYIRDVDEGYQDRILDNLVQVMWQEIDRINAIEGGDNKIKVEFYNDGKSDNGRKFQFFPEFNAIKDTILTTLRNIDNDNNATEAQVKKDAYLKELLDNLLKEKVNRFINSFNASEKMQIWDDINKASTRKIEELKKKINNGLIDGSKIDLEEETKRIQEEAQQESEEKLKQAEEYMRQFYYNNFYVHSQLIQILGGDLAYYKNFRDYIKRNKQAYACGDRVYGLDENGEPLMENCMYVEDLEMVSNSWSSVNKLLSEDSNMSNVEKSILRGAINSFKNITSTDGQSFRTMKSFRRLFKAMGGKWTESMENSYNRIRQGQFTADDFLTLLHPIKPFVFSQEAKMINGRMEQVKLQHKNSEYLINAVYSMLETALNKSPELQALHQFMEDNDIDVLHFHSVVKEGYFNGIDINHDERAFQKDFKGSKTWETYKKEQLAKLEKGQITQTEYNESISKYRFKTKEAALEAIKNQMKNNDIEEYGYKGEGINAISLSRDMIHSIPFNDIMIVQPTGDHLIDAEALIGSQLRNIIPADLPEDFTMELDIRGEKVTLGRKDAIQLYNTVITDQLLRGYFAVKHNFSDKRALRQYLFKEMENNPKYGDDIKAALQLQSNGEFVMPFNSSNLSNKIDELLLSTFKNNIQRQHIAGGNVVLVSNYGLSDELHVQYKNAKTGELIKTEEQLKNTPKEDLAIDHIPCYLPYSKKEMLEDFLEEQSDGTYILNFESLKKSLGKDADDFLQIIGYRIPTEDKYSIMPMKVVGFMPSISGTTIMLPSDIVTMSGTDFDIDKLFLMIKEVRRETYDKKIREGFAAWVERENIQGAEDAVAALTSRNTNLTDQEVMSFERKYDSFRQYVEEDEGYKYSFDTPRYRTIKPRKYYKEGTNELDMDAVSKNASKEESNNLLIDIVWKVLTSPAGSRLSMMPGSYPNVKLSSRQQRILHDPKALTTFIQKYNLKPEEVWSKLNELSVKELDAHYEENSTIQNPMDILDYADNHRNLMDGNDLIGILAVNSSNHYKFQFLGLHLKRDVQFMVDGKLIEWVDPVNSPINGVRIGRICAELQVASFYNSKDPCWGDMNINVDTVAMVGYLCRVGIELPIIGMVNNSEELLTVASIINDYAKNGAIRSKDNKPNHFNLDINRLVTLFVMAKIQDTQEFFSTVSRDDLQYLKDYREWHNQINKVAKELQSASAVSRCDSPNGALAVTVAEAMQQRLKAEEFVRAEKGADALIEGLGDIVDITIDEKDFNREDLRKKILNSPIPRLQAAYTLGHKSAYHLSSRYLPYMSENVYNLIRYLTTVTHRSMLYKSDVKTLKQFVTELNMYLMSQGTLFGNDVNGKTLVEKRNYYLHDFPMKFKQILSEKDDEGNFVNSEIRNMAIIKRMTNASSKGIKMDNVAKITPLTRKHYTEEFDSLLFRGDKEAQLAEDLFCYSYFDNGISFRYNSFGNFFGTTFLSAMPRHRDNLIRSSDKMTSDVPLDIDFVWQFIVNHPKLALRVDGNMVRRVDNNTIKIIKDNEGLNYTRITETDSTEFIKIIKFKGELYRLNEPIDFDNLTYSKLGNVPYNTMFYDSSRTFDAIDYSELKGR